MRRAYRWDEGVHTYEVEETWHDGESLGGVVIRQDGDEAEYDDEGTETLVAALVALRESRPLTGDAVLSYTWAHGDESATSDGNGGAVLMSWHGVEVALSRQGVDNVLAAIALLYPPAPRKRAPDVKYVALWEPNTCAGECGDKTITHWRPLEPVEPVEPAEPKWAGVDGGRSGAGRGACGGEVSERACGDSHDREPGVG